MLKLLIFDLDGTLADTSQDVADAINYAVAPYGAGPFSVDEVKKMVGSGISKLIESLVIPQIENPPSPSFVKKGMGRLLTVDKGEFGKREKKLLRKEAAVDRFVEYYSAHLLDNTKAYPEVRKTLLKLENYKKAVISNKRESFSRRVIEGLGLLKIFDVVLGSDSVPEIKPSPVPILEVLKRLGVSKDEAVMIGDSNYDIESAHAAGIKVIAVTYGFRSKEVLQDADFMIDNFGKLVEILQKISKQ
ncbi:MAG: HAD-IA family hydrolase [Nitrospirae bacterium]|nr:HAD-IA family hydrolase [Nitrospirota bacterium]